jgi:DNA-3-methyladenine glycosylase
MNAPLPHSFFDRPTVTVAKDLIGCQLVRKYNGKIERFTIIETEAYDGPADKACHAYKGRTKRTEVLFGMPGHFYVYFVYGMHWLLNVVTGPEGYPSGVLIRGVEGCIGPARITKKLSINGLLHGMPSDVSSELWIEGAAQPIDKKNIQSTPRIGVDYAGPLWAKKKYRFVLQSK